MGKLIYAAMTSLDGYIEDVEGEFDWSTPDEEVHAFVNDLVRPIGTYLSEQNSNSSPNDDSKTASFTSTTD